MAHLLASCPACAASAVSPSICTTAPPRRGFLFGDCGSSSIARACHHCRALVTPATRPGRRRVTIGNRRNSNSLTTTTTLLPPRFSSGKGVKGETGSRTRSAARRASTERVRISGPQARPLMPLERPKPLVWGAVKEAKRPAGCTPDDRGRLAPFPLGREGRGDGWRARNAPFSRSPACRRGGGV